MSNRNFGRFVSRLIRAGATLAVAAIVAACASSDVTGVRSASHDQIRSIAVSEVVVTLETPKPNPQLQAALKAELERTMPRCALGQAPHRMEVAITEFEDQDVAKAILVGDEIELAGRVSFIDTAAETMTGEYFVENSFFWGGFLGAAMMSGAERRLSEDFAKNLCAELFGVSVNDGDRQAKAAGPGNTQPATTATQTTAQAKPAEPEKMCRANVGYLPGIGPVRPWEMVPCEHLIHSPSS